MTQEAERKSHTLADHHFGVDSDHVHEYDTDHDHDHADAQDGVDPGALRGQDEIALTSVGIDVGSAGTQVVFARLELERHGLGPGARYAAVRRTVLYQSPVELTPYAGTDRIDGDRIGDIIERAYAAAGLHPDAIDAGAVILTGVALERENAQAIAEELAEIGGEFVCAAAGHHMEAMLSAYGSGSALLSHERNFRVLNIDIGGGTSKLALIDDGKVVATAAIAIGGRLVAVDDQQRITRFEPCARLVAEQAGFAATIGDAVAPGALEKLAETMAERLLAAVKDGAQTAGTAELYLTEPLELRGRVDAVRFSGGVAEYFYRRETRDFGDLGRHLGLALRARVDGGGLPWRLLPAGECIRATALGASSYGLQLSGRTIYVSDPAALLPRRNLQVLLPRVSLAAQDIDSAQLTVAIRQHFARFDRTEGEGEVALAFRWQGEPSYQRLAAFARGIVDALPATIARAQPIYIVLDGDVAQSLGALLKEEMDLAADILVVDGVTLWDFDYIDLGRIRMPSYTVPVTIKSLIFKDDPRQPHTHGRHHSYLPIGSGHPTD